MQLSPEEAVRLYDESPLVLSRVAIERKDAFVYAVRDTRVPGRAKPDWGGELRVCLNQNVVLHFVPGFNEEMPTLAELPQYTVMPSSDGAAHDEVHAYEATGDLDAFEGVVFWTPRDQYSVMVKELVRSSEPFDDRTLLPDNLFGTPRFVNLVNERVLAHRLVRAEGRYDYTKRSF